jgi:DNA invertase Pin-like site-specific DNA recombinase
MNTEMLMSTKMNKQREAILYIRRSSIGFGGKDLERMKRYAQSQRLRIIRTIVGSGVSAFRGTHLGSVELGRFLNELQEGKFKPGSVLLVESLDRLSRKPLVLYGLLAHVGYAGMDVVTVADKQSLTFVQ